MGSELPLPLFPPGSANARLAAERACVQQGARRRPVRTSGSISREPRPHHRALISPPQCGRFSFSSHIKEAGYNLCARGLGLRAAVQADAPVFSLFSRPRTAWLLPAPAWRQRDPPPNLSRFAQDSFALWSVTRTQRRPDPGTQSVLRDEQLNACKPLF